MGISYSALSGFDPGVIGRLAATSCIPVLVPGDCLVSSLVVGQEVVKGGKGAGREALASETAPTGLVSTKFQQSTKSQIII